MGNLDTDQLFLLIQFIKRSHGHQITTDQMIKDMIQFRDSQSHSLKKRSQLGIDLQVKQHKRMAIMRFMNTNPQLLAQILQIYYSIN